MISWGHHEQRANSAFFHFLRYVDFTEIALQKGCTNLQADLGDTAYSVGSVLDHHTKANTAIK